MVLKKKFVTSLLSYSGFGTKNECKKLINQRLVSLNGELVKNTKLEVDPNSDLNFIVNNESFKYEYYVYYILNKPENYGTDIFT